MIERLTSDMDGMPKCWKNAEKTEQMRFHLSGSPWMSALYMALSNYVESTIISGTIIGSWLKNFIFPSSFLYLIPYVSSGFSFVFIGIASVDARYILSPSSNHLRIAFWFTQIPSISGWDFNFGRNLYLSLFSNRIILDIRDCSAVERIIFAASFSLFTSNDKYFGSLFFFARRAYIHSTIMILLCMFAFGGRGAFKIKIQRISSAIHYRFHFLSFYFHFCLLHALSSIQPQCCLFVRLQWHTESLLIKNNSDCDCDFDCDSEASLSHFRCLWIKWTKIA